MSERIPVKLVIGDENKVGSFGNKYWPNVESILKMARKYAANRHTELRTNNITIVRAFEALHRLGEIELKVVRAVDGERTVYDYDVKGDMIQPWPDDFFELSFYLMFPDAKVESIVVNAPPADDGSRYPYDGSRHG